MDFLHNNLHSTLPVELDVGLVIIDYGVNDAVIEHFDFDINNVKMAHELFLEYVTTNMLHTPALLYAETFIAPERVREVPRQATNMAEIHAEVTRKYDIPMVRDALSVRYHEGGLFRISGLFVQSSVVVCGVSHCSSFFWHLNEAPFVFQCTTVCYSTWYFSGSANPSRLGF